MRSSRSILLLLASAQIAGCAFGGDEAVVSQSDRDHGAEQHPQLLAEFGGAYKGDEAEYLRAFGNRVAATAGLEGKCTFTLVNSDVANAFAVPGCFIYVTRGLVGIVNSEAELGAVLSHEVGHIVARHSQRQQRRSLWRTLGVVAVQVITGSAELSQIAGAAAGYFTLRYSRTQEYEADDLGLKYLRELGYDPFAATDMLAALGRHEQYVVKTRGRDEARSIPEWARTHPLTDNRIARASEAAAAMGVKRGDLPEKEAEFLRTVDGMLYGDDPQQGFVIGRAFAHPVMRVAFEAPQGFTLTNSPQAILIEGPDGMRGEFAGGQMPAGGLEAYTNAVLGQMLKGAQLSAGAGQRMRINGLDALVTPATVQSGQERVALTLAAYAAGRSVYHFVMVSSVGAAAPAALEALFGSFRLIGEAEARSLRPRRIDARRAGSGDTVASFAAQMAGDNKVDHFLMLNGRKADQPVRPGELVKLVVYGSPDQ